MIGLNVDIAGRLDEMAQLLTEQGANRFRVQAYRHAANVLRNLPHSVSDIFAQQGIAGLKEIPGVGESIAHSIQNVLLHGRLAMLERLVMLACQPDAGRVRTFIPCLFRKDHLVADLELIEARVEHAVFVKVNLAAIRRLDEAIAFFGKELADFSVRRRVMRLHVVAQRAANVVL